VYIFVISEGIAQTMVALLFSKEHVLKAIKRAEQYAEASSLGKDGCVCGEETIC